MFCNNRLQSYQEREAILPPGRRGGDGAGAGKERRQARGRQRQGPGNGLKIAELQTGAPKGENCTRSRTRLRKRGKPAHGDSSRGPDHAAPARAMRPNAPSSSEGAHAESYNICILSLARSAHEPREEGCHDRWRCGVTPATPGDASCTPRNCQLHVVQCREERDESLLLPNAKT